MALEERVEKIEQRITKIQGKINETEKKINRIQELLIKLQTENEEKRRAKREMLKSVLEIILISLGLIFSIFRGK